jgi:SAM-dependent methyltransferase
VGGGWRSFFGSRYGDGHGRYARPACVNFGHAFAGTDLCLAKGVCIKVMESEAQNVIALYDRHADDWTRDRSNKLFEAPWLDRFLALIPTGASILDIGCGSAEPIGRYFIERGYEVIGTDSSPALIDICKGRFPDQEWIVADMRALSLGRTFGGIIAWDSFFHLCPEDQRKMFPIFRDHAAQNTALMFTSGPSYSEVIGTIWGEPLYHASLNEEEYCSLLDDHGFNVVAHIIEDPDCGRHTVWLARLR